MFFATVVVGQASIVRLGEEIAGLEEAQQVVKEQNASQVAKLREETEELRAQAEQVEVLMARCARLEVSAAKQFQMAPMNRSRRPFREFSRVATTFGSKRPLTRNIPRRCEGA